MKNEQNRTTFAMIGAGWRAEFYLRVAQARPDLFAVTGLCVRDSGKASELTKKWQAPVHTSLDALLDGPRCDFVVTSVPRKVNPDFIAPLVDAGVPVLSETPPAADVEGMTRLTRHVAAAKGRVQVAEQYHLQPHQAARLAVAASGRLGAVSQAQVSVAHGYHGISLIRRYLGVGYEAPKIRALSFASPMVEGPGRSGPPPAESIKRFGQTIGWLDFGGKLGVFDFVGTQYFGWIRGERVLVRGERGEIANDTVSFLLDYATPLTVPLRRVAAGSGSDLEGHYLKGYTFGEEWVYRNPLAPARLFDDEIAVGACLLKMKRYVETGEEFYPLAEACQDHYLSILLDEAAVTGVVVCAAPQPWQPQA